MKKLVVVVDVTGGAPVKELFAGDNLDVHQFSPDAIDIKEGDKTLATFAKFVYWRELE